MHVGRSVSVPRPTCSVLLWDTHCCLSRDVAKHVSNIFRPDPCKKVTPNNMFPPVGVTFAGMGTRNFEGTQHFTEAMLDCKMDVTIGYT